MNILIKLISTGHIDDLVEDLGNVLFKINTDDYMN